MKIKRCPLCKANHMERDRICQNCIKEYVRRRAEQVVKTTTKKK